MNHKFHIIKIIFSFLCFLFFSGCETEHHDYHYIVQHSAGATGGILLTYSLTGVPETQQKWLEPDEFFEICERKGVAGSGIWNIETSPALYAIPKITATNHDASKITEELSQRKYWSPQPEERDGKGFYTLKITDDLFVLERQEIYGYYIHNAMDDSLFVTCAIHGDPGRSRDTIVAGQTANIGQAEIYTYTEDHWGTDKYIERKLSGISSLSVKYKEISKTINFNNRKLLRLDVDKERCTLTVDQAVFEMKDR
jgi:hypothetical protein